MTRKRAHIPLKDIAAAFASLVLSQEERDDLRARKVSALAVLKLFTPDHIVLHCHGGSDAWHNLDMRRRGSELKAKDARDTSIAAKGVRIEHRWQAFTRAMAVGKKPPKRVSKWPKRKMWAKGK